MPLPALIPLAVAAVGAASKLIGAAKQRREAKKAAKYVPAGLTEALNETRLQSMASRYPGQDMDEANVRQGTSNAFANAQRATRSSSDLLNVAAQLQGTQNTAMQGIARQGQVFRQNSMDKYRNLLLQKADVQMGGKRYSEALKGAANQNTMNAVNDVASGIAMGFGGAQSGGMMSNGQNNPLSGMSNGSFGRFDPMRFSSHKYNPRQWNQFNTAFNSGF